MITEAGRLTPLDARKGVERKNRFWSQPRGGLRGSVNDPTMAFAVPVKCMRKVTLSRLKLTMRNLNRRTLFGLWRNLFSVVKYAMYTMYTMYTIPAN